jgi:hypothetical protein
MFGAQGISFLSREIFRRCTARKVIFLLGSSHNRYMSDFYNHNYINPNHIFYHNDHRFSASYIHKHLVFARFIAEAIEKISCDRNMTVIIETGSWDLKLYPLANFILNPKDGPKFIQSISSLMQNSTCRQNVKLLITSCPPYRECKNFACKRGTSYWRTNAAIRAFNQYVILEIMKLNLSSSVKVLDNMPILLPRTHKWKNMVVESDHYLFSGYLVTPQGISNALEILHEICRDVIEEVSSSSDPKKSIILGFDKPEVLFAVPSGTSVAYYIWHVNVGCYQQLVDIKSMTSYGYRPEQFPMAADEIFKQCIPYHGMMPLNGVLWQAHGDRIVYFMDSGYRRPVNSIQTLINLGRDISEVRQVSYEELSFIPMDETLYNRDGVNYLKHNLTLTHAI